MYVWLTAAVLFVAWAVCTFVLGKGGFIHLILLTAVAFALAQFVQERRAAQR